MSKTTDQLIDSFVGTLTASGTPIAAEDNTLHLEELEARLPKRLPQSFESLLSRYSFPTFDAGGISFFGWSSQHDEYGGSRSDRDSLSELLRHEGYFQIGRPETGSFDAVCFDLNSQQQNREFPIVVVDHEEALCNKRVRVARTLWLSFRALAEGYGAASARR